MKLAVFGASGATGRHLVRLAAASGMTVSALVRSSASGSAIDGAKIWSLVTRPNPKTPQQP